MSTFIELGLSNAVVAGGLAMIALIVSRCCKNPTVTHGLWALVILKLLTPPLWTLPVADVPVIDHATNVFATGQLSEADKAQDDAPVLDSYTAPLRSTWSLPVSSVFAQSWTPNLVPSYTHLPTKRQDGLRNERTWAVARWSGWSNSSQPRLGLSSASLPWRCSPIFWQSVTKTTALQLQSQLGTLLAANPDTFCGIPCTQHAPGAWNFANSAIPAMRWHPPMRSPAIAHAQPEPSTNSNSHPVRFAESSSVVDSLRNAMTFANRGQSSMQAEPAATAATLFGSSTESAGPANLKRAIVGSTNVEYWLSTSQDAIEFLAKDEAVPSPQAVALQRPALDYVVVLTQEGNILVVPGGEFAQFADEPMPAKLADKDSSLRGQPGELRTVSAQGLPEPGWSAVWGTRLARLWDNCRTPLAALWGVGSLWCLVLAIVRIRRFHKVLARTEPAPAKLIGSARRLAKRIGLRKAPQVRLAPGVSNPLVWRGLRTSYIVLPAELLRQLSRQQAATLLTHELAHLRRKDHVMRWLELAATILYWWNPILWFARRQLRASEERCCDAWVVWAMPQAARDYLDTVLKTVDFLSQRNAPLPLAATGMGHFQELRTRFEQVITNHQDRRDHNRLSRFARCGLAIIALAMLPLVPTLTAQGIAQATVILQEVADSPEVGSGRTLTVELQPSVQSATWRNTNLPLSSQLSRSAKNMPGLLAMDAEIEAVATSVDGRWLAVGRTNGTVELYQNAEEGLEFVWSSATQGRTGHGDKVHSDKVHSDKVASLAFSQDGRRLASAGRDGQVQVRDAATGEIQHRWQASDSWLTDVAFSAEGEMLAVGGYDRTLQLFDLEQADEPADIHAPLAQGDHDSAVRAIAFLPQSRQLASVDSAGNLSLWGISNHGGLSLLKRIEAHHGVARDVTATSAGNHLATVGEDGQLKLWSWAEFELSNTKSIETNDLLSHVSFGFDDRLLVSAGWNGEIRLHDATTGEVINKVAEEVSQPVRNLAINRRNILLAGGQSAGLSLWGLDKPVATVYLPAKVELQPVSFGFSHEYATASSSNSPALPQSYSQTTTSLLPKNLLILFSTDETSPEEGEPQAQPVDDVPLQQTPNEQFAPACDEPNPEP